jgi:hypothetical protein
MEAFEGPANKTGYTVGEEFWDDLLAYVDEGSVIPVVGPELLTIKRDGSDIPLYRVVAEEILNKFGVPFRREAEHVTAEGESVETAAILRSGREVSDAVCALYRAGKRFRDLYRPLHEIVGAKTTQYGNELLFPLKKLASVRPFRLFVSTTWDNLLATAIDKVCHGGEHRVEEILYALNLPGDRCRDLPEFPPPGYTAVFYLFGKSSPSPVYAIHEEETIPLTPAWPRHSPERMLGEIRRKHLLFIGCPLADWLGRFLVRLSNKGRLYGERDKREFIVTDRTTADEQLTGFLERFSQNTCIHIADAHGFVDQLLEQWQKRHPELSDEATPTTEGQPGPPSLKGMIFISYASEDRASALRLCDELKALAGDDIAWLDKGSGLTIGDDWLRVIERHVTKECKLFLPLISSNTERRTEGFFRREWKWAAERDEGVQGRKFIMPLIIDSDITSKGVDELLIPDRFRSKHVEPALGGHLPEALRAQLAEEIRKIRRESSR